MNRHLFARAATVLFLVAVALPSQFAIAHAADLNWSGYAAAQGTDWVAHKFRLDSPGEISAVLDWSRGDANLNLHLRNPAGRIVASAVGHQGTSETLTYNARWRGVWTLGVKARSGAASYTLGADIGNGSGEEEEPPRPDPNPGPGPARPYSAHPRGWTIENEANTHNWSDAQAIADAKAVDLIVALPDSYRGQVGMMRQANPDLLLLNYVNGVYAQNNERDKYPASWYLYDRGGRKILNNYNLWMMDPSNPGWIANRVQQCEERIASNGYDGCSVDNLGHGTLGQGAHPINKATGQPYTDAQWIRDTVNLARQMRNRVAPDTLTINGLMNGYTYFSNSAPTRPLLEVSDGGIAETFMRTSTQGVNSYRSEQQWKADVDMLVDAASRGDRVFTVTKVWVNATAAQEKEWHQYAYASFLLGDDGDHRFTFSGERNEDTTDSHRWWSVDLGRPQGRYSEVNGLYQRSFARGRVFVNPTDRAMRVDLPSPLRDLDGTVRSTVPLPPHTGWVLTQP